jgi:hypothetical protein
MWSPLGMDSYAEWTGPNIKKPASTSENFTLDFGGSYIRHAANVGFADVLVKPDFKVLLNNRWGLTVVPVSFFVILLIL